MGTEQQPRPDILVARVSDPGRTDPGGHSNPCRKRQRRSSRVVRFPGRDRGVSSGDGYGEHMWWDLQRSKSVASNDGSKYLWCCLLDFVHSRHTLSSYECCGMAQCTLHSTISQCRQEIQGSISANLWQISLPSASCHHVHADSQIAPWLWLSALLSTISDLLMAHLGSKHFPHGKLEAVRWLFTQSKHRPPGELYRYSLSVFLCHLLFSISIILDRILTGNVQLTHTRSGPPTWLVT